MYHFGDTLFAQPFIKHVCDNNKNINFFYFILYGHALFRDINNLGHIDKYINSYNRRLLNGEAPEKNTYIDRNLYDILENNKFKTNFTFYFNNKSYIAVNIWCIGMGCNNNEEMDIYALERNFFKNIDTINNIYNLNIIYNITNKIYTLPYLSVISIDRFIQWNNNNKDTKKILFYNYVTRSAHFPYNLNNVIYQVANKFKDIIFIVPQFNQQLSNIDNIKFCDIDFDCIETPDCNNILMINQISELCDFIICPPTGGSWIFFNNNFQNIKNKVYIIETTQDYEKTYTNKMNIWLNYAYNNSTNNKTIIHIHYNDIEGIINNL
jgi:hypothetical protein